MIILVSNLSAIKNFYSERKNLIENQINQGFVRACNLGVNRSNGTFIFITNQDVIFLW